MSTSATPLRQRMIDDMTLMNLSPSTHKVYTQAVANFALYFGQSPDRLGLEQVRTYRLHLIERGLKPSSINPIVGALRFFYGITLKRKDIAEDIPYARREDTLPAVLAPTQVVQLLKAVDGLKMRVALTTIYAAGLRVSEVVALTAADIDSRRMVIRIRQAKGRKDRYVMLSEQLLGILRRYYKEQRPQLYLFPGRDPVQPMTVRAVQLACREAADKAGIAKSVTVHTLRHSFATHLLEQGVDIRIIQDVLGHRQITSTARYARVATNIIAGIQSPLERLDLGSDMSA